MNNKPINPQGEKVTLNIWLCPDGVYRWTYEYNMLKNPTIIFTVWKVLGIAVGVVLAFDLLLGLIEGNFQSAEDWQGLGMLFLILTGIMHHCLFDPGVNVRLEIPGTFRDDRGVRPPYPNAETVQKGAGTRMGYNFCRSVVRKTGYGRHWSPFFHSQHDDNRAEKCGSAQNTQRKKHHPRQPET